MSPRRRGHGRGPGGAAVSAAPGDVPEGSATSLPRAEKAAVIDSAVGASVPVSVLPSAPRRSSNGVSPSGISPNGAGSRRPPRVRLPQPTTDGAEESIGPKAGCTLAQMRRFIKSRPYVPVHELRRRFLIEGIEDEVSPVATDKGMLYVGLPEREAGFLGELIKAGEVGCELLLDPTSPAVIGVFPMRPVARQ
jgi:hypothetical protein